MSEFTLVNLNSQREAVKAYTKGWDILEILQWMRRFGTVTEPREDTTDGVYVFESHSGFKTAFYFTEDEQLDVINSGWF